MRKQGRIILSLVLAVTGIMQLARPTATVAEPGVQTVAGTGTSGFSGDGGPATAAQLSGPAAIAFDASGKLDILDLGNRRIRAVDAFGTVRTQVGDGSYCTSVTDPALPVSGMCPIGGMAAAPDGTIYYSQGGSITQALPDGTQYHYAGKYYGFDGPYDDGPRYAVSINPGAVAYDPASGYAYFTEDRDIRAVTPSGQIITIAGVISPGSAGCNSASDDITPALGSCIYPRKLVFKNGKLYFTEQSSWNGPRARVIENGTIRTLAGNSTRSEPIDGALATASGFSDMSGITVDAAGNLYLSGQSRGQIWKVAADTHIITKITEFPGGAGWLETDAAGNLYVSLQYLHEVVKITGLTPPKPLPKVADIALDAPSPADALLTRGVTITPADNGVSVDHFEYAWATSATASDPSTPLQRSDAPHGRLHYNDATPDHDWYLLARGVTASGEAGPWSTPHLVHTPKAPSLIILGDSLSSGHHNDYGDNGHTTCDDPSYGYASDFSTKWRAALPAAWRQADDYANLAHSGFATQKRAGSGIGGSVLEGGTNACQTDARINPLQRATLVLSAQVGSWNRVVISAGINDTNWGDAVKDVIQVQLADDLARQLIPSFIKLPGTILGPMKESACRSILSSNWNGRSAAVQASITGGVNKITTGLRTADPDVNVTWLGYYNIAGTGTNQVHTQPYFPSACAVPVNEDMGIIHSTIQAGLAPNVRFLSLNPVLQQKNDLIQPLFLIDAARNGSTGPNPPGWPHPNSNGAQAIADLLQP
jgi:hypothetical protein